MDSRPEVRETAIEQALLVMDAHISALNKRDANAVTNTLHFPHHRLTGDQWKTWETAAHYFEDFLNRAGSDWNRSTFENIKVVDSSVNKVHLDVEVRRYDASETLLISFRSLWIIIEIDGVWAAKVRSTFAPQ